MTICFQSSIVRIKIAVKHKLPVLILRLKGDESMSVIAALIVPHPPIILPEVGRGEEKKISKTSEAYIEAMRFIASLMPETIVITSPHSIMYEDYIHISPGSAASGDMGRFNAGSVRIRTDYDTEFVSKLGQLANKNRIPAGTSGERDRALDHGTMIPLYFLNKFMTDFKTVRIGLSGLSSLSHYKFGECIARAAEELNRRVVIIASGDLSHKLKEDGPYGFAPEGTVFDLKVTEALEEGDFLKLLQISPEEAEAAAECGLRSFQIMAGALDGKKLKHELISYEGPFGVGYAVAKFEVQGVDESRSFGQQYEIAESDRIEKQRAGEDEYVRLARLSIETYIKTGKRAVLPEGLEDDMAKRLAGTFVSLKKHGQLRGCIGTISATTGSVAEEIMKNAISAAVSDPRFEPITAEELPELSYSVDVLGDIESISSPDELDVKRYGVIVESGMKRGLLLPNLEGVDSVMEQIDIALRKAGIRENEKVKLSRFEVVRHK